MTGDLQPLPTSASGSCEPPTGRKPAVGQHWNSLGDWGQAGVLAGAAVFFLLIGIVVRRVREPAIQRLAGVVWFLSVACLAGPSGSRGTRRTTARARSRS